MPYLCIKCNNPIKFKMLQSGKKCPVNLDDTDHWDICKKSASSTAIYKMVSAGVFTGNNYYEVDCDCLPWVGCEKCKTAISEHHKKQSTFKNYLKHQIM